MATHGQEDEEARLRRLLEAKAAEAEAAPEADAAASPESQSGGPQGMEAVAAATLQYGQEAFARQLETWAALTAAKTPEDMAKVQAEAGRKALETYVEHSRRLAGLMPGADVKPKG